MSSKPYALTNPVMTKRSVSWSQYFYFFMSLVVAAVIVERFQSHHPSEPIDPQISRPRLLYFHAALFTGWLVFFNLRAHWYGRTTCGFTGRSDAVRRGNPRSADSAGGSGNCRDNGQIRHDAIENEQRCRRHDHSHVGHGGLHSGVCTGDLLEEEAGIPSPPILSRVDGGCGCVLRSGCCHR